MKSTTLDRRIAELNAALLLLARDAVSEDGSDLVLERLGLSRPVARLLAGMGYQDLLELSRERVLLWECRLTRTQLEAIHANPGTSSLVRFTASA